MQEDSKEMEKKAKEFLSDLRKNGVMPTQDMFSDIIQKKRNLVGLKDINATSNTQIGLLITASRQVKQRWVPLDNVRLCISQNIHTDNPIEMACSRLSIGPWADKTIRLWYNPERKGNNKRASKLAGFGVGGEIFIMLDKHDIQIDEFIYCEKGIQ